MRKRNLLVGAAGVGVLLGSAFALVDGAPLEFVQFCIGLGCLLLLAGAVLARCASKGG